MVGQKTRSVDSKAAGRAWRRQAMAHSSASQARLETLMTGDTHLMTGGIALQRCDRFVGRTTNWLYDHLRHVLRYRPVVLCDELVNRDEFPELDARSLSRKSLKRRLWHRIAGDRLYPSEWARIRSLSPRIVHSHFGDQAVEDVSLMKTLGVPWFVAFYGADVYELGGCIEWRSKYGRVFNDATRVLALGPMMKARLEDIGCPPEKVTIHPLGVDIERLPCSHRVLRGRDPLQILFTGSP